MFTSDRWISNKVIIRFSPSQGSTLKPEISWKVCNLQKMNHSFSPIFLVIRNTTFAKWFISIWFLMKSGKEWIFIRVQQKPFAKVEGSIFLKFEGRYHQKLNSIFSGQFVSDITKWSIFYLHLETNIHIHQYFSKILEHFMHMSPETVFENRPFLKIVIFSLNFVF